MKFPTQQDSWTDTTRNMTPFWPAAVGGILVSLEVDDGVQLREGRVGAGVGLSLQIPHRHLAVVVPRQQVPAAPVPTSTWSAHRHYSHWHLAVVVPRQQVPAAPVPTSTWSAHRHYSHRHLAIMVPQQQVLAAPVPTSTWSAHRHYSQQHLAVVVPRQQVRAAPVPTSTWSAHRHYSQRHLAVVVPRQQVQAASVPTSTSSQHTDTTVSDTLPLWFPDSRYGLLLCPHQRQVSTQTCRHLHLAVAVPQ